jgi:S-adenosylmethionine synthetase
MPLTNFMFTSESVTEGHPDKIADQISDAILDDLISQDKKSRVAAETLVTTGMCLVAGEITTEGYCDIPAIVRETIKRIGYNDSSMGFDWETCAVLTSIDRQSQDISVGVSEGEGLHQEQGAGDQGLMFGYACDDTPEFMPMPIVFAHNITRGLADARREGILPFLRPDGKSQVTIEYVNASPKKINTVVVSTQHSPDAAHETIKEGVIEEILKKVLPEKLLKEEVIYHINPTGRFVLGGPHADCGLTGRKIIVDTYGGQGSHGGGAFSGKDPSKVDRSASYMARYIAKNIVAAGLAKRCEVQIAYAIGVAEPVSVLVNPFGTGKIPTPQFVEIVRKHFPLNPRGIIEHLDLLRPIYRKTAAYGHFGRDEPEFTWERTDKAEELRQYLP